MNFAEVAGFFDALLRVRFGDGTGRGAVADCGQVVSGVMVLIIRLFDTKCIIQQESGYN